MILSREDWIRHFNEFCLKATHRNGYSKMGDYDCYRHLCEIRKDDSITEVIIDFIGPYDVKIQYNAIQSIKLYAIFNRKDNSIGSFLFDKFDDIKEEENMGEKETNALIYNTTATDYTDYEWHTLAMKTDIDNNWSKLEALETKLENIISKYDNKEEKKEMKGFNFDFGKIIGDTVRVSAYGIAVKNNSGSWVAYDHKNQQMMDVDILSFTGADMLYKMPVAIKDVQAGDVIIHNRRPCFVESFSEDGKTFTVIDIVEGEQKSILPIVSPFGFSFVTKVVTPFSFGDGATADNPFGGMLPFFMLMGDSKDVDPVMMMLAAGGGKMDMSNPAMLMLLADKDGSSNDMMKMFVMAQMFNQNK